MPRALSLAIALALLGCGAIVGVAAGQDATTSTSSTSDAAVITPPVALPAEDMPLSTFAPKRRALKAHVNAIRVHKYRGRVAFRHSAREIRPTRRSENLARWRHRLDRARSLSPHPLYARAQSWYTTSGASCVKSKEAGWTQGSRATRYDSTLGVTQPIYAGGFQADDSFLASYGHEFLRRHGEPRFRYLGDGIWLWTNPFTIAEQKITAFRGWRVRGFYPWPLTAHYCGLI